ncbi:MAG: hypothetical protein CBD03_00325 [Rhizobiales bacterium TMED143]|nr:hypothetical protein [Rhodobiaceae bacterium]OUV93443.1 MAG: hypothetical protein CBD03_00325 [Rhizobiales bacterium TMED143]HCQ82842.1 hypothetical protein [Rhodobiaceae bacterium]
MIADFIRVLRAADVRVSPAEAIDAADVIGAVGLSDRDLLKNALGQCLAKTEPEKRAFDTCFDTYFITPDMAQTPPPDNAGNAPEEASSGDDMAPQQDDAVSSANSLEEMLTQNDQAALQAALADAAAASGLEDARLFTQQGMFTRRILDAMGLETLDAAISQARAGGDEPRRQQLEDGRAQVFDRVSEFVERQIAMRTKNAGRLLREEALSRIRLGNLDKSDMKIMRELIRKLAKRLATRHARRRKKAHRGMLDVRRTMRRNMSHDGLLFDLHWKRTKIERPRLVVMCDVSGSVAAVSRFFLMFLYSLDEVMPRTRSFVFSNRAGEISEKMSSGDMDEVMTQALREYGGGSTDYGTAMTDLADAVLDQMDHRTTVLVLGDARSNFGDPGHLVLKEMATRARRVIWLNPEPEVSWNTGDSEMRRLGAYCNHVQVCNSVKDVERVLDNLLKVSV